VTAMVFLNTAWMERYDGPEEEKARGGGSYVDRYGYGHEMFNFRKINGKVYGYAQPTGRFDLQRLGASSDAESIDDVLVIFTATHKLGGTYIVGWYKNATLYKECQSTRFEERNFNDEHFGYYVVADAGNATLLSADERLSFPQIPRAGVKGVKGGMGQSNVWYADSPEMTSFRKGVLEHIEAYAAKKRKQQCALVAIWRRLFRKTK